MRTSRIFSFFFGLLGILLAFAVVAVCVLERDAAPKMLIPSEGASRCADSLMQRICAGDYAGASAWLYGHPVLDSGTAEEGTAERMIWDAFTSSLEYELVGSCRAEASGVVQEVTLTGLEIPSVTAALKQRAAELVEQKVAKAVDMSEIYAEDLEYREDFVQQVLQEAVETAIAQDGRSSQQTLSLKLICDKGQWLVVPDQALLNAISGGILG